MGSSWTDRHPPSPHTWNWGWAPGQPASWFSPVLGLGKQEAASPSPSSRECASSGWTCQSWSVRKATSGTTQTSGGQGPYDCPRVGAWTPECQASERAGSALLEPRGPLGPRILGTPKFWGLPCPRRTSCLAFRTPGGHADVPSPASSLTLTSGSWGWHGFITPWAAFYLFGK